MNMKRDFWKAVKLLLTQLLDLNINEQLLLENEYLLEASLFTYHGHHGNCKANRKLVKNGSLFRTNSRKNQCKNRGD